MSIDSGPDPAPSATPETQQDAPSTAKSPMPPWAWAVIGAMAAIIVLGGAYIAMTAGGSPGEKAGAGSGETTVTAGVEATEPAAAEASETVVAAGDGVSTGSGTTGGSSGSSDQGGASSPEAPAAPTNPSTPDNPSTPANPNTLKQKAELVPSSLYGTWLFAKSGTGPVAWNSEVISPGTGTLTIVIKTVEGDAGGILRVYTSHSPQQNVFNKIYEAGPGTVTGTSVVKKIAVQHGIAYYVKAVADAHTSWKLTFYYKAP